MITLSSINLIKHIFAVLYRSVGILFNFIVDKKLAFSHIIEFEAKYI